MQLFFAILPAPSVRDELVSVVERDRSLAPSVRFDRAAKWHVTLSFLGQLEVAQADLARRIARELAPQHAPFPLSFGPFGVFPDADRPKVLWLGVHDRGGLRALAAGLGEALGREGFSLDERPYHPHLTLARIKARKEADEVRRLLETARPVQTSAFVVDRFMLFETRDGAYHPLEEWPLGAALTPATAP